MSQSKTSAFFQNETLTHFFESALLSEGLGNDMTPCFYNSDQIFIKVTFSIENRSQRMFNLCEYSLGTLISSLTGVSLVQIRQRFKVEIFCKENKEISLFLQQYTQHSESKT